MSVNLTELMDYDREYTIRMTWHYVEGKCNCGYTVSAGRFFAPDATRAAWVIDKLEQHPHNMPGSNGWATAHLAEDQT